jgi:hypothetical protein
MNEYTLMQCYLYPTFLYIIFRFTLELSLCILSYFFFYQVNICWRSSFPIKVPTAAKGMFVWWGTSHARAKMMKTRFLNKLQWGMNHLRTCLHPEDQCSNGTFMFSILIWCYFIKMNKENLIICPYCYTGIHRNHQYCELKCVNPKDVRCVHFPNVSFLPS